MKKNNFVEGTLIATLNIVLVKILGMLYVIPFYNIVGSQGGALYSYAYNIYMIFLSISSAGLPNAIAKIISEYNTLGYHDAKNRAYKIGRNIIAFISIIAFLVLFIFADEIAKLILGSLEGGNTFEDVAFVIRCVAPAVLIIPFLSILKGYFQGHKYVSPSSISQVIEQVVRIFVILCGSYLVLKVFNGTLKVAVGLSVAGAFFGGLAAYIFLRIKLHKNKKLFDLKDEAKEKIDNKTIIKKIFAYSIPFVVISVACHIYNTTDQILVLHTLDKLHFSPEDVEHIASAISTWSSKICMIINAMSMGMTVSLIPSIVAAHTEKDDAKVSKLVNQSITMVAFISLPLATGLCVLAKPVWYVFYGASKYGPIVLAIQVFSALIGNIFVISSSICQGLSKYKTVYITNFLGFILNALLDVPMIYLCNAIGWSPVIGSSIASMIGYTVAIIITCISLNRYQKINFGFTIKNIFKMIIPAAVMAVVLIIFNKILPFAEMKSTLESILLIVCDVAVGAPIFIGISWFMNLFTDIMGKPMVNRLLKKMTFGKLQIK